MAFSLGGSSRSSGDSYTETQMSVLPAESVLALEETTLSPSDLIEAPDFKCPITHEALGVGDSVIKLPCGHMFEPESIKRWLTGRSATCPVCRASLPGARAPPPAITTQPVAVVSPSERVAVHRQNIDALAQSILELQERQMLRLSERRANRLLQSIQRDVDELRDLGYVPSVALSSILPTSPPLHTPRLSSRYGPDVHAALLHASASSRAPLSLATFTRRWLEEAGREHQD